MAADDGDKSRSGDARDGELAGLTVEEGRGVLAFLDPKRERVEDGGCCDCSGCSEDGLVAMGEPCGDGDLDFRRAKELDRKREGRLEGTGACMKWR